MKIQIIALEKEELELFQMENFIQDQKNVEM